MGGEKVGCHLIGNAQTGWGDAAITGDEINAVGGKRSQCLWCDRYLPGLPHICSVSGLPHLGRGSDA